MADPELLTIDGGTEFGARVIKHLTDDIVVWLTTVTPAGAPQPSPVWFLWDGAATVRMLSLPGTARTRNLAANPRVSLNFAGTGVGGDIVVLSGTATLGPGEPDPRPRAAYLDKYAAQIQRIGMTPESFRQRYSQPITITLHGLRGH